MKKRLKVMLLGSTVIMLTSDIAYGFWTDKLGLKLKVPLVYNLEIIINESETDDALMQVEEKLLEDMETKNTDDKENAESFELDSVMREKGADGIDDGTLGENVDKD